MYVRHFLDAMHIEKNVFDSIIGTLLNVLGKSKDDINVRLDLIDMGIRTELAPVHDGKLTFLPPTAHPLSRKEKEVLCQFLHEVNVPEGYSSNISNLVSMKDLKLRGLKFHDCHVLMEHLLPIGIRSILPENVRSAITKLYFFFRAICIKVINPESLQHFKEKLVLLCVSFRCISHPHFLT